jgi:hypothetical protein
MIFSIFLFSNTFKYDFQPAMWIYPNPAAETVHIDIQKDGNYNIDVVNVAGQKVMSTTLTKGVHTIDVKHFATGVYYYTIQSADGKIKNTDKLIIIK